MFRIPISRFETADGPPLDELHPVCLVIPILAGRSDDARAFMRELEHERADDYAASERRIGIGREVWHLAGLPDADVLIAHIETADFAHALNLFAASAYAFDLWFKRRLAECTGLDLNDPPPISLPELLFAHNVPARVASAG